MSGERRAREAAETFRAEHSLGVQPIADVAQMIERTLGIGVAQIKAPSGGYGHGLTKTDGSETYIAVACTPNPMRLRSTLAHELGHIRLETVVRGPGTTDWSTRTPEEREADSFARHLLIPIESVRNAAAGREATERLLSDLTQEYMVSARIAAIQLREAGVIDAATCEAWRDRTTPQLADRFGWRPAYNALVAQSQTPKAPQRLLAKAIEGYRLGAIQPAMIGRLLSDDSAGAAESHLHAWEGIEPFDPASPSESFEAQRPPDSGMSLTTEELEALQVGDE